jgi:hypothetical protein
MMYESPPTPLLALRTVTYCTENEWTPGHDVVAGQISDHATRRIECTQTGGFPCPERGNRAVKMHDDAGGFSG